MDHEVRVAVMRASHSAVQYRSARRILNARLFRFSFISWYIWEACRLSMSWNTPCEIYTLFSWVVTHLPCLLCISQAFFFSKVYFFRWGHSICICWTTRGTIAHHGSHTSSKWTMLVGTSIASQFDPELMRRFPCFLPSPPTTQQQLCMG